MKPVAPVASAVDPRRCAEGGEVTARQPRWCHFSPPSIFLHPFFFPLQLLRTAVMVTDEAH